MTDFPNYLSSYMKDLSQAEWLHQLYSRLDWRIVQQFTHSGNSYLAKNEPGDFSLKIDGPGMTDFASSSPLLSQEQQTNLLGRLGMEVRWFERQDVAGFLAASVEYIILAIMVLFFLFAFIVCVWQAHRYAGFVQETLLHEEVTWFFALQTFFTFSPLFIALLANGIYGLMGIFFVFSLIGLALAIIFLIDRVVRNETENLKLHSAEE